MGRATYSSRNTAKSVVTQQPAPPPGLIWDNTSEISAWRVARFDPDGEEFFREAEYEAPLNPDQVRQNTAEGIAQAVQRAVSPDSASDTSSDTSSESGIGDRVPVAPRAPWLESNPAQRRSDAVNHRTAPVASNQEALASHVELVRSYPELTGMFEGPSQAPVAEPRPQNSDNTRGRADLGHVLSATRSTYQPRSAPAAIPAMYVPVTPGHTIIAGDLPLPAAPRPAMASPAPLTSESPTTVGRPSPRTPSPSRVRLPQAPSTPFGDSETSLMTPSPPGSATPAQVYTWRHNMPAPVSPTPRIRASNINRESPLTNPRARMSYARLVHVNPPILVHRGAN